jgi:hypothetical protein
MSAITQGNAQSAGAEHSAQQAEFAAQGATINANSTDAYYRDDLRKTLANIDAVRTSAGVDASSPTTQAVEDEDTRLSDNQRIAKVVGLRAQAGQDVADAGFYNSAADAYTGMGYLKAAGGVFSGMAQGSF